MLCSGKYTGLLVSGVLAYYWIEGRKKFTLKKPAAKFFIVTGLLLILGVLGYNRFTREWEKKSYLEWYSAKRSQNIRAFEDLIDAAHLKKDNIMKFRALKAIAEITRERGDIKYSREMFRQAVDIGKNIQDKQARYNVLKEIVAFAQWRRDIKETKELLQQSINAFQTTSAPGKFEVLKIVVRAIARPGAGHIYKDLFQQAILAAESIKDFKEKSLALNEMAVLVAEPGNIKQSELILQQAVDTADKIKDNKKKFDTLNKMAEENKKWAETIFLHAVQMANRVADIKEKIDIYTGIAKAMARAGDSRWSDALFQKALDTAKSIEDNQKKAAAFSFIALGMTAAGNKKKGEHIFQQAIEAAEEIDSEYKRFHVFIQIAAGMLETGDIKPARDIIEQQLDEIYETWSDSALTKALLEILGAINKSKNFEWAEDIFLDAIDKVELMDNMSDDNRVKLLRKIVRLIGEKGDIEYFRKVYLWVIDATGTIEYPLFQITLYREISLAIAKGGDRQWAETIAMKIPDYEWYFKKNTLKEIRETRQKIRKK
jgi:tetratricopeptide (TPR) repeat protein